MALDKRRVLFVGGIPSSMTVDTIREHFSQYDKIVSVRIMKDHHSMAAKGYAYVTVSDHAVIPLILGKPQVIAGRTVDVQVASRRGEKKQWKDEQKKRKVFVTNIPSHIDNDSLQGFFSQFGEVRNAYVIRDFVTKASLNYGFVEFHDPTSWETVMAAEHVNLDGAELVCLPFQGKTSDSKHLAPTQERPKCSGWDHPHDGYQGFNEIGPKQQNYWRSEKEDPKSTYKVTYDSNEGHFSHHRQTQCKKRGKYEFIGMSSRICQDESNYRFRIKLENRPGTSGSYFSTFTSRYRTFEGPSGRFALKPSSPTPRATCFTSSTQQSTPQSGTNTSLLTAGARPESPTDRRAHVR